jgi:hypothetical protein
VKAVYVNRLNEAIKTQAFAGEPGTLTGRYKKVGTKNALRSNRFFNRYTKFIW